MIINNTRNTVLAKQVRMADTPLQRMKGLLGRKAIHQEEALVISPCNCVHTLFMRFAVDLLYVSKDNTILKAVSGLRPFRLGPFCLKAYLVIELPKGKILSTQTLPGDKISIV